MNLGVVLVDNETKTIFVFFTVCAHYYQCNVSSQFYIKSYDDGLTWTQPYNVSQQIGTKMFAGGPGYGFQVSRLWPNEPCYNTRPVLRTLLQCFMWFQCA